MGEMKMIFLQHLLFRVSIGTEGVYNIWCLLASTTYDRLSQSYPVQFLKPHVFPMIFYF